MLARPVREAGRVAARFGAGDTQARIAVRGTGDVALMSRQFNAMADDVTRTIAAQRRFVSDTAHELRTPTAALLAAATALDHPSTRDEAAPLVAPQLRRLSSLTEDLLALSRFDDDREELHAVEIDLADLVQHAPKALGADADVVVHAVGPVAVEVDPVRVQAIVRNLVSNGLRHGLAPVVVRLAQRPDHVVVTVTDSGAGVPQELRDHLFDRFVRGDTARGGPSSGLGLALARENARLHGGDLELDEDGQVFRLTLPRRPVVATRAVVLPPAEQPMVPRVVLALVVCAFGVIVHQMLMTTALPGWRWNSPFSGSWWVWLPVVLGGISAAMAAWWVLRSLALRLHPRMGPVLVGAAVAVAGWWIARTIGQPLVGCLATAVAVLLLLDVWAPVADRDRGVTQE